MKGWRKPKAFAAAYSAQKRFLAFVLTLAMIFTSVGTDLNVSYAAQGNKVDFEIYGSDLVNAINEAVESDNVVKPDSLEFTNGAIDKFETLFYGEGKVYEVYPQIDGGDMDAELRVFVRLPEDADDMYMVTGDEEVIFLYVNNGDETISCATRIIRSVDGEEKVKTTKRINVKSYEDKFGDEEVDIVSKKDETVEETTAAEEKSQDTVNDTASEETTTAEEKETEITDETAEATEEETTEAAEENTEAETEEATEATEAEKETEAETEKETAEETEKETAEEKADAEGEVTASLSRHYAPVVAMKEDAQAEPEKETAEAAEIEKEVVETEKETTEAVEKETADAVETEKENTEAETKDAEVTETETEAAAETEETAEDASKEETAAGSKENEETEAAKETVAETSKAAETTAEAKEQENKKAEAATDSDLVGIGYCSTAKAYTTTVKALKALDDIQGLKVTYAINPEYSARIVDGPRGVEEGDALVFGVKNQIGYAIESVTANGEFLEADSTSDNEDGSVTAWYTVPEVTEEQEIEVYMTETDEHPEFNAELTMEDGTIITLHAAEGVLPAGVTAEATVKDDLADALKEKVEAENADAGVEREIKVAVYDINLMLNGHKLDNSWSENGSVKVTFSGSKVNEISADTGSVEIFSLDDAVTKDTAVENLDVEYIATAEIDETADASASFDAKHFSLYGFDNNIQSVANNERWKSASFNPTIINAQVGYVNYRAWQEWSWEDLTTKNVNDVPSAITITPVTGPFTIDEYVSNKKNGHVLFFVKADENYLLTGLGADGNGDLYSLAGDFYKSNFGNIQSYPELEKLVAAAKEAGYQACFGYYRGAGDSFATANFTVKAYHPGLTLTAQSNKTSGVKPNDQLTFIIKVTPDKKVGSESNQVDIEAKNVVLNRIEINNVVIEGDALKGYQLRNNGDGTYTVSVPYTATLADCQSGSVTLKVSATTDYEYKKTLSIGSVTTATTVEAEGSVDCLIAGTGSVQYLPKYDEGAPENKPAVLSSSLPRDNSTYYEGQNINIKSFDNVPERVDDPDNNGYWERENIWKDAKGNPASGSVKKESGLTTFTVKWTFYSYVTIHYQVKSNIGGTLTSYNEKLNPYTGTAQGSKPIKTDGYTFAGWYENADCTGTPLSTTEEKFVPAKGDGAWIDGTTYYAKFVPRTDLSYTVHHYKKDTNVSVAPDEIINNVTYGTTQKGHAKTNIIGYQLAVGEPAEKSVVIGTGTNEITFNYVPKTNVSYKVYYKVQDTQQNLGESPVTRKNKTFNGNYTETAPAFSGYELVNKDQQTQNIKLDAYGKSITFWYKESAVVALHYTVADDSTGMGDVSRNGEDVLPVSGKPNGSTANAKDGYNFVNWTVNGVEVSNEQVLTPAVVAAHAKNGENVFVPTTFVANFQRKLVLKAKNDQKTYDGTALTGADAGYEIIGGQLKAGDRLEVTYSGSQTDVGKIVNRIVKAVVYRGEEDVTSQYAIAPFQDGELEVTPATVTMRSASATKTYDGTPLTKTDEMVITGFADGEGVVCYEFASQTDVGSTSNTFKYRAASNTKLSNYDIKPENITYGTLTVTKITTPIVVTADSLSKVYDGTPLTGETYKVTGDENLVTGDRLVVNLSGSITNVSDGANGTVTNKIDTCKVMRGSIDVTANYTIETHDGTLTVMPRQITLTSATKQKPYDGKPLTDQTVTATAAEGTYAPFADGEGLVYNVTGSQLDEGSSDNTFTYEAKKGTDLANYKITKVVGTLTVTKNTNQIVIVANSKSKMYDGTPLTDSGYTYTTDILAEGDVLTATVEGTITNVGETANKVKSYVVKRGDKDVTKNYTFGESISGTLEITKRDVTITSGSSKRAYNGQPLTNSEITVTGTGFVTGEAPTSYEVTGTITNVGEVDNTFTYQLREGVNADNYDINLVKGKLEITPVTAKIQITADSDSKVYDGIALVKNSATYTQGILADNDRLEITVEGSQLGKGESANTVTSYKVLNAANEDVTGNYTFAESVPGKLTVTARPITIKAASDSKEYDGTPLTADSYTVSENGLADSDEISAITIDGSQIEIGTSSNAVRAGSVKITKKAEAANSRSAAEDVTDNYDIKLEEGILEVTNRNDLSYIVNYHYLDAKGKEVDVESVTKDNAFIGEEIAYSDAVSRDHAGKTYALIRVDNAGKTVEYYADGAENPNVVDVYYGLDEIGTNTEKPKTPDGIPDMYQVVFRYISENPSYGTVDGAAVVDGYVMEVVTRPQKADGSYDMDAEVYPLGNVTVTGIGNYTFNHWSDGDTNYANANEIAGHGFKSDMTFVAHFSYDGGNNNNNNGGGNGGNGGGNGGSGSTSGGGSSSSGSRGAITVTSGGPGDQTVTIDAGDVPLAELPDAPVSPVEIDDGEVPLAALPKTGQTTMKLTITLMFSGIFLALTAMSKKHKEEES